MKYFILFIISLSFFGCSSIKTLRYTYTLPAKIEFPSYIQNIGVIDRSIPNAEIKNASKIDEILSQEGFGLDKKSAEATVLEMVQALNYRNLNAKIIDSVAFKTSIQNQAQEALDWDTLTKIAELNQVDAVFVLEFLDTKSTFKSSSVPANVNVPFGGTINSNMYTIKVNTDISIVWRLYDTKNKRIMDERKSSRMVNSSASGISILTALSAIKNRESQVIQECKNDVYSYINNFFPSDHTRITAYYCRGSKNLKNTTRMVETLNLEKALYQWKKEDKPKTKAQGRSCYNQAVAYDFLHLPDSAKFYASKSYEDFGEKRGLNFSKELNYRNNTTLR